FAQMRTQSLEIARGLVAAGIRHGDHVAICAGNSVEWAVLFHGIVRVGAVCVPVNTRLTPGEIRMQLERSDARMLITVESLLMIDFVAVLREICPAVDTALPSPDLPHLTDVVVLSDTAPGVCRTFAEFLSKGSGAPLPPLPDA